MAIPQQFVVSNAVRWDKAKNPIFWISTINRNVLRIVVRLVPDNCLTNGICGLDYRLWWYRIPLAFDRNPILILPRIVAGAVTIGVRAHGTPVGDRRCSNHFGRTGSTQRTVKCWVPDKEENRPPGWRYPLRCWISATDPQPSCSARMRREGLRSAPLNPWR
jgi:hypothetical protein